MSKTLSTYYTTDKKGKLVQHDFFNKRAWEMLQQLGRVPNTIPWPYAPCGEFHPRRHKMRDSLPKRK